MSPVDCCGALEKDSERMYRYKVRKCSVGAARD